MSSSLSPMKKRRRIRSMDQTSDVDDCKHDFILHEGETLDKKSSMSLEIPRQDFVRLILQTLEEWGYKNSAQHLELESGIELKSTVLTDFCHAVEHSLWDDSLLLLPSIKMRSKEARSTARLLLLRQKYAQLLVEEKVEQALVCLRCDIVAEHPSVEVVNDLAMLLVCGNATLIKTFAPWYQHPKPMKTNEPSKVLADLERCCLAPGVLVPRRRLHTLVSQCLEQKVMSFAPSYLVHRISNDVAASSDLAKFVSSALFHEPTPFSKNALPVIKHGAIAVLEEHTDEIWDVQFAPSGKYLASLSRDGTIRLYTVRDTMILFWRTLHNPSEGEQRIHRGVPMVMAWSPSDEFMLVCYCDDKVIVLWDVQSGKEVRTYQRHEKEVQSIAWLHTGEMFVSGALDLQLILWNLEGDIVYSWNGWRINDLAISKDNAVVYAVCSESTLRRYRLTDFTEETLLESDAMTFIGLADDDRFLLVSKPTHEGQLLLWDATDKKCVGRFTGHRQGRNIVRARFGGEHQSLVASGSEDSCVYIWSRYFSPSGSCHLVEVLRGHAGTVNSVAWHPSNPNLLVSASDDHTIRIWSTTMSCPSTVAGSPFPLSLSTP